MQLIYNYNSQIFNKVFMQCKHINTKFKNVFDNVNTALYLCKHLQEYVKNKKERRQNMFIEICLVLWLVYPSITPRKLKVLANLKKANRK